MKARAEDFPNGNGFQTGSTMKLVSKADFKCNKIARNGALLSGVAVLFSGAAVFAQAPDNSKANQQDRGGMTAEQQAENPSDRALARKIRKSIMEDKNLSTYTHNVKVIARDGTVTLKGPVRSDDERAAIARKAVEIAGAVNVKNELTVKAK